LIVPLSILDLYAWQNSKEPGTSMMGGVSSHFLLCRTIVAFNSTHITAKKDKGGIKK
jgi:hypothetical protein